MSRGLSQKVTITTEVNNPHKGVPQTGVSQVLEGTTHKNLRSKITKAIDLFLIQYNVMEGAKIEVVIEKVEGNEYANPER